MISPINKAIKELIEARDVCVATKKNNYAIFGI